MSKIKFTFLLPFCLFALSLFLVLSPTQTSAITTEALNQEATIARDFPPNQFFIGKIVKIASPSSSIDGTDADNGLKTATVVLLYGSDQNRQVEIPFGGDFANKTLSQMHPGEYVLIMKTQAAGEVSYYVADKFRLPSIILIILIFFGVVGYLGGKKGLGAVVGLGISILAIIFIILPSLLAGYNPYLVGLLGTGFIACLSIYAAHGFNRRTTIGLQSTLITLTISFGLSILSVWGANLFGLGSEEARLLNFGLESPINLQGLLVLAIILGTLGVLDDTTINQTHIVYELSEANPNLTERELYNRSLSIGREHIASLVNTLFLAYIGAFLPLFVALTLLDEPFWVTLNREMIGEEIIRSVMGSLALILAVPISSYLASRAVHKTKSPQPGLE